MVMVEQVKSFMFEYVGDTILNDEIWDLPPLLLLYYLPLQIAIKPYYETMYFDFYSILTFFPIFNENKMEFGILSSLLIAALIP